MIKKMLFFLTEAAIVAPKGNQTRTNQISLMYLMIFKCNTVQDKSDWLWQKELGMEEDISSWASRKAAE